MRHLLPWLLTFTFAGCGSAPPVTHPTLEVEVPGRWQAGANAPEDSALVDVRWWDDFGSSELSSLVEEALTTNHDLQVAVANVDAALATARIEGADAWPQVQGGLSGTRSKQNFIGFPLGGGGVPVSYSTQLSTSVSAAWELDLWGRVRNAKSAALAEVQATQAESYGAALSVSALVTKAWLEATEARLQLELARSTRTAFQATEDLARERYSRGLLTAVDVHLTRTSTATAAALVARREEQLEQAARRLELLLGRYPAAQLVPAGDLPSLPGPVPPGLPADLVSRRPDLAAAERRLAASGARVGAAKAARYPRISLTGSAGTRSTELDQLLDGDFSVWSLVGNLVQPLFQGGRLTAQVELAEARGEQAIAQYAQAVLEAFANVETALAAEQHLQRQVEALRRGADSARAAWELAEDQYTNGLNNLLTVLESQRRSLQADSDLLLTRRLRLQSRVDLYVALGGGFDAEQPLMQPTTNR